MQNPHFLPDGPNKPIFHKNLDVFIYKFPYTHDDNTLLIDNMPYKNMFNNMYNVIFLESFNGIRGEDQHLLGSIFPYFKNLHLSKYNVHTFVEHNPFGRIRCID
jgi:hypothetical protein